jgi:hypothetical protein
MSSPVQGICSECYIDPTKLIFAFDLTVKKELAIDTTFDPPWFSSDSSFKKHTEIRSWAFTKLKHLTSQL